MERRRVVLVLGCAIVSLLGCEKHPGAPPPPSATHSASMQKGDSPSEEERQREFTRLKVARSDFMRPLLLALYDPRENKLRAPRTNDLVQEAADAGWTLKREEQMALLANRELLSLQLSRNEPWMQQYFESVVRRMEQPGSKATKVVLLKSKCGLSEEEAWIFVGGR